MSHIKDFSRWNRSGLNRFEYIDANAITLLETLRQSMIDEFTDPDNNLKWSELEANILSHETHSEKNQRLLEQYHDERRDYAWELMRSFSRSVHVTLEHLNAYANEGYIGTATQWENIRRLVSMLDYYPAPSASAYTDIALMVKASQTGKVEAGWQVKNAPEDGSAPLIFETLEDIEVNSDFNRLYPYQWDQNHEVFLFDDTDPSRPLLTMSFEPADKKLSAGYRGIALVKDQVGNINRTYAITIEKILDNHLILSGIDNSQDLHLYQLTLLFNDAYHESPKLHGPQVVLLEQVFNFKVGSLICWLNGTWKQAQVIAIENNRIQLDGNEIPQAGNELYLLLSANKQLIEFNENDKDYYLILPPSSCRKDGKVFTHVNGHVSEVGINDIIENTDKTLQRVDESENSADTLYYQMPDSQPVAKVSGISSAANVLEFSGQAKDLSSDQWLLCRCDETYHALQIVKIEQLKKSYQLTLDYSVLDDDLSIGTVSAVRALFSTKVQAIQYNRNQSLISGAKLELDFIPEDLKRGQKIIIQCQQKTHQATIIEIEPGGVPAITIAPALVDPYMSGETIISANIVAVGHGETKPEKILGSGDATEIHQSFVFETKNVAFVADPEMNSGVRADIELIIDGRIWQQKSTLNYSSPTDPHYVVRMTEEGYLKISFGDGKKARRLPTGKNNIRVRFRIGTGTVGNLPAGSLIKAVKPHNLIINHTQPLPAAGGNGIESVASIRQTASANLMTFERAVSLRDFISLAASHSSVWQASAVRRKIKFAQNENIEVVIIPAGGGSVSPGLNQQLRHYLTQAALPGVKITITDCQKIELHLNIIIRVKYEEYDHENVKLAVIAALENAFNLTTRKIGQVLYRSEIYKTVESVTGVENSDCIISQTSVNSAEPRLTYRQVVFGHEHDPSKRLIKSIRPANSQIIVVLDNHTISVLAEPFVR